MLPFFYLTLSERPPERMRKDITKVVSDGEINPRLNLFLPFYSRLVNTFIVFFTCLNIN